MVNIAVKSVVWCDSVSVVEVPVAMVDIEGISVVKITVISVMGINSIGMVKISMVSVMWSNKSISLMSIIVNMVWSDMGISVIGEVSVVWVERVSVMDWSNGMMSQDIISMVSGIVVTVVSMVSNNVVSMVSSVELSVKISMVITVMVINMVWDEDLVVIWGMVDIMSIVVMGGKDGILLVLSLLCWSSVVNIMVHFVVDWSWCSVVWDIVMS